MITFFPVARLRELGKRVELKKFNESVGHLNSVEKFMAGVLYRFALDTKCPAVFIKVPVEGDEPIKGLRYEKDFDKESFMRIAYEMFELANENFGTNDISLYSFGTIYLLMKNDFKEGAWADYGFEIAGVDGISISS